MGACLGSIANNFNLDELNVVVGRDKTRSDDMDNHFNYVHRMNLNRKKVYGVQVNNYRPMNYIFYSICEGMMGGHSRI